MTRQSTDLPSDTRSEDRAMEVAGVAVNDVLAELWRAIDKFPGQHLPNGTGPDVPWIPFGNTTTPARTLANRFRDVTNGHSEYGLLTWADVILEEVAEAMAEEDPVRLRAELVQVGAMIVRWLMDVDDPRPVFFTSPSGRRWREVGRDDDGNALLQLVPYSEVMVT